MIYLPDYYKLLDKMIPVKPKEATKEELNRIRNKTGVPIMAVSKWIRMENND